MTGGVAAAAASLQERWRRLRNPAFWLPMADTFAVLTALTLPWSTTLVSIFSACWIGSAALIVDYPAYFCSLKRPACAFPLALFALAAVGTLWSEVAWSARLWSVGPAVKLLFLPGLFHHFQRSPRGIWVLAAFVVSCAVLMVLSWIVWFAPEYKVTATISDGVPVKNYIEQTQELALCVFVLAAVIPLLLERRRLALAALCIAVILAFVANMTFVAFARTALIYLPVMLILFAVRILSARAAVHLLGGAAIAAAAIWSTSPYLRHRVGELQLEYQEYVAKNAVTSAGERIEYWRKSVGFFMASPLFGNGTGSILQLFERSAVGQAGVAAGVIRNPHNQTLHVAVQWGAIGVIVLWGMWISHLLLFRGEGLAAWIGLVVVVQNMASSLTNSHIFDFHAGWMYVLGVGVAGGIVLKRGADEQPREAAGS